MPTTENTPPVPPHKRSPEEIGQNQAFPAPLGEAPDMIEESELPAVEVSNGAGIDSRNTDENGDLNEAAPGTGFLEMDPTDWEDDRVDNVFSTDQDNNRD